MIRVSEHFALSEFLPAGTPETDVPEDVLLHLTRLADSVLEPVRAHFGLPLHIHSGWRPPTKNSTVGGVPTSDHMTGRAADFHIVEGNGQTWEANTHAAFDFVRTTMAGLFGQLILEDHRVALHDPGKLWVHVAVPSPRHPGDGHDLNAVLYSYAPGSYELGPREADA